MCLSYLQNDNMLRYAMTHVKAVHNVSYLDQDAAGEVGPHSA